MNINELLVKEENELSEGQLKFITIHNKILNAGSMIMNSVVCIAKNLKVMKDEKLYLEVDCETFEDYAEKICGLKRSQAYSYIHVLDKLGSEFIQVAGQIGITKLSLLASTTDDIRKSVSDLSELESITVNELKKKIHNLEQKNLELEKNVANMQCSKDALNVEYQKKYDDYNNEIILLQNKISKLQNEDLNNVQSNGKNSEIDKLKTKISELKKQVESSNNLGNMHLKSLKQFQIKCENLQKQLEISKSSELFEFKIKFNELQQDILSIKHLITKLPEDKRENCELALKKVVQTLC